MSITAYPPVSRLQEAITACLGLGNDSNMIGMRESAQLFGVGRESVRRWCEKIRGQFPRSADTLDTEEDEVVKENQRNEIKMIPVLLLAARPSSNFAPIFSQDEEKFLVEFLLYASSVGAGYDKSMIRELAREWARSLGNKTAVCTKQWLKGFLARNKEIVFFKPSKIDMKRLLKADREVFEKHFITIESIFRKHNDGNLPKAEDVSNT